MNQQSKNRTIGFELSTSAEDIYVVPSNYETEVTSIIISNAIGTNKTFSLSWYNDEAGVMSILAQDCEIGKNSIVQITDPLWLRKGDKITGLASDNSAVTVSIVVKEYFLPLQY